MPTLASRIEVDYRLIFLKEEEFHRRMCDIYLNKSRGDGAPFLDEIIEELWDFMVLVYIESIRGTSAYDQIDWNLYRDIELNGDPFLAADFMWKYADPRFPELFHRDVELYLLENQLNFFVRHRRDDLDRRNARLFNSIIVEVW